MVKIISLTTRSAAETQQFAAKLGSRLQGNETISLSGDLGAGKTHWTQGLVAGAGIDGIVTSPTFVLLRIYKGSRFSIHHFDAYRLDAQQMLALGIGDWLGKSVNVVEWGERVSSILPQDTIWITIEFINDSTRKITISYPDSRAYFFEEQV